MFFSFYPTKPVGGMDGCVIVSDDFDKIQWFREAAMNGMSSELNNWEREIKFAGWKMYMNSFQAYVALQNFHKLEKKKKRLKEVREYYNEEFGLNNTSEHLYRINVSDRDSVMSRLKESGISCGVHYAAMHLHSIYVWHRASVRDVLSEGLVGANTDLRLVETEREACTTLSIPYHEKLSDDELIRIRECLK
jgi:dTDP-4-amino-4,6-dideoxygalactose transaminase